MKILKNNMDKAFVHTCFQCEMDFVYTVETSKHLSPGGIEFRGATCPVCRFVNTRIDFSKEYKGPKLELPLESTIVFGNTMVPTFHHRCTNCFSEFTYKFKDLDEHNELNCPCCGVGTKVDFERYEEGTR